MRKLPALSPGELVRLWTPWLRKLAWRLGIDEQDVVQEAWLQALETRHGENFVPRWLQAVRVQAGRQRPGLQVPAHLVEGDGDDPLVVLLAVEAVAALVKDQGGIRQVSRLPKNSGEVAASLRCTKRHARRILAKQRAAAGQQGDLFGWGAV